jgi:hypothetical protein
MPFRIFLKLSSTAAPHIYIDEFKKIMSEDKTLHPQMKNTLLLVKKTRMPFIRLAEEKEIVFDDENFRHFERALKPQILGWVKVNWSEEEIEDYNKNKKLYLTKVLEMFSKLGYVFYDKSDVTKEELKYLLDVTASQNKIKQT